MKIRRARIEDAVQLIEIIKNVEKSGNMLFEPGERTLSIESANQLISKLIVLVAVEDQRLIGYMMVKKDKLKRIAHKAYIAIGIHSEARGRGIGSALFYALFELAKQQQIHRLELTVLTTNEAALNLYQKMGFEIEGRKKDSLFINGEYKDELCLSKLIS